MQRKERTLPLATWTPDPTFYPSPKMAMQAPQEELAYVAIVSPPDSGKPDAVGVMDVNPDSDSYGELVGRLDLPNVGDELHHFGWNACSASLCPNMPHPHVERRYLLFCGLRSSRIYVVDTKPDPRNPVVAKVIEPDELAEKTGYSRPHTVHCGPDAIYINGLGAPDGGGPGGVFTLDHDTFDLKGAWEADRGEQVLSYDFGWHFNHDTMITSEWGTPDMVESGVVPELLLGRKYGHQIHIWDYPARKIKQTIDIGDENQMVLELRPARDPRKAYGFAGVVTNVSNLSGSIWLWHKDDADNWDATKVIEIAAEPADAEDLPPLLQGFGAVPPIITDINLSLDDKFLYVSCWGTGEFRQYDVSDPFNPKLTATVNLGGIIRKAGHPKSGELNGGPQMVEVSRDGERIYVTNSLYVAWDNQFYPEGVRGWAAKINASPDGGMTLDEDFFMEFGDERVHQIRLQGGDASSDTFCYSD